LIPHAEKGGSAMILFPAMMVGGNLLIAVVDKVPDLNFEPICRDAAGQGLGLKDESAICVEDEKAARGELGRKWSEFESADRARCIRLSTLNRAASYVEVLTCLEMNQEAKKLHRGADAASIMGEPGPAAPAREKTSPQAPGVRVARQPVSSPPPAPPLPLESRPAAASGFLQILCLPGLKSLLPACSSSGARP
jgi:hypothetical protein